MTTNTTKEDSAAEEFLRIKEQLIFYATVTQNNDFNVEMINRFGKQDYYGFRQMIFRLDGEVSRYETLTSDAKAIVRNNSLMMAKVTLEEIEKMPIAQHVRAMSDSSYTSSLLSSKHIPQETAMSATTMVKEPAKRPRSVFLPPDTEQSEQMQRQLAEYSKDVKVVEKITFIDPSELPPETVEGFEDPLVVAVARHYGNNMICHSANGVRHYSVFRLIKVVGVCDEPVNGKVLLWIKGIGSKPFLKISHVPKIDLNDWVKEEDLLFSLLPLKSEAHTLDPVLEAALRCAPKEVLQSYLEWGIGGYYGRYPTLAETLAYLQGG